MTTDRDVHATLGRTRPHGRRMALAVLAALASLFCALSMISKFTRGSGEMSWFMFVFAGFGAVGFAAAAIGQWQEWPQGEEPAWTYWLGTAFWGAFGLYQVYGAAHEITSEGATNWPLVALLSILAALMLGRAYEDATKALHR